MNKYYPEIKIEPELQVKGNITFMQDLANFRWKCCREASRRW